MTSDFDSLTVSLAPFTGMLATDGFDQMIASRSFTNGADAEAVKKLFRNMSRAQLGGVEILDFQGMPTPSCEDAAARLGSRRGEGRERGGI